MESKSVYYLKNIFKNYLCGLFPNLVTKIRAPSGRPHKAIDSYHFEIFTAYFKHLGIEDIYSYLNGKTVLEIGPGDILGTAFYSIVYGASKAVSIDRFPLANNIEKQMEKFTMLADYLPAELKEKGRKIAGNYEELLSKIVYHADLSGKFMKLKGIEADLILSNAVLEHVYDIHSLLSFMKRVSRPGTIMFHGIDLRSHKMHFKNELDFLDVDNAIWKHMTNHRGAPNRLRRKDYSGLFQQYGFDITKDVVIETFQRSMIEEYLREKVNVPREDIEAAVMGFVCRAKNCD